MKEWQFRNFLIQQQKEYEELKKVLPIEAIWFYKVFLKNRTDVKTENKNDNT